MSIHTNLSFLQSHRLTLIPHNLYHIHRHQLYHSVGIESLGSCKIVQNHPLRNNDNLPLGNLSQHFENSWPGIEKDLFNIQRNHLGSRVSEIKVNGKKQCSSTTMAATASKTGWSGAAIFNSVSDFDNTFASSIVNISKSSGAVLRSLLQPKLRLHQVSTRTFKTLRAVQAEETRNPNLFNRIINRFTLVAFGEAHVAAKTASAQTKIQRIKGWVSLLALLLTVTFRLSLVVVILWCIKAAKTVISSRKHIDAVMQMSQKMERENEVQPEDIKVTFSDVKGAVEPKSELQDIVEFLRNPDKFTQLGGKLPKGVLLVGPPGTGKTLLARAVAGEAKVPFFYAAGSEFEEMWVGVGARRVRQLFKRAKAKSPCVIFIDEIDSIGGKRRNNARQWENQTINQLLSEMDGFRQNNGVIVLGATNRREDLDAALLRPGRFDVQVEVPAPGLRERKDILEYYLGKVKRGNDVDVDALARGSTGFTGADLENMVNQAALRAAMDEAYSVRKKHLEFARDKIIMGVEKKSRISDESTNLITAYHEGGHALVAYYTKEAHPLHKVTIIPRGASLGHTSYLPAKEQHHVTKEQLLAMMDTMMGGRAAEEIIFGSKKITSGASSDLVEATNIATLMVKNWGMSEKVGLRTLESNSNTIGPATAEIVDLEIKRILQESYDRAKKILTGRAEELKVLAEALIKYETLDAEDVHGLLSQIIPHHAVENNQESSSLGSSGSNTSSNANPNQNKDLFPCLTTITEGDQLQFS